jgi:predicted metal-dependent phosphotriesterase family hydrolase
MRVETMRGARAVDGLGATLMHEHVFVLTPDLMQNYGHEWWWDEALKDASVDEAQITAMLVHNPARYFTGGQE